MGAGSSSNRRVTVRLLGTEGVGKSTLIEVMAGFAARGGDGGLVPGGCAVRLKGVEIYILETHFSELDYGKPDADMWYPARRRRRRSDGTLTGCSPARDSGLTGCFSTSATPWTMTTTS